MTKTKYGIFAKVGALLFVAVALIFCGFTMTSTAFAAEAEPCEHEYEESVSSASQSLI